MASVTEHEAPDVSAKTRETGRVAAGAGALQAADGFFMRGFNVFRAFLLRGRFSSLTRRIVVFNVVALCVLVSGVLYLNQFREGLIDARRQSLLTQAEIIAGAIAEGATTSPDAPLIDPLAAGVIIAPPPDGDATAPVAETIPINPETAAPILR